VSRNIEGLSETEIGELERIMDIPDQDMLSWATRQAPVPPEQCSALLSRILVLTP
jgi:succinate dehydrogenase flavin-adding protein (antitoxin of CptAB toxin-antitoxin module)